MNFRRIDRMHGISACGRYAINRGSCRGMQQYMAVRMGASGLPGSAARPSERLLIAEWLDGSDEARGEAWRACVAACEADAARAESKPDETT